MADLAVALRRAEERDLPAIGELYRGSVARMHEMGIFQWDDTYPTPAIHAEDVARGDLFVCDVDGRVAAAVVVNGNVHEDYAKGAWRYPDAPYLTIHRLCVGAGFHGRGVAKAVMRAVEGYARSQGAQAMRLDTFSRNPIALRLYDGAGYARVGEVQWPRGTYILFEKRL